MANLVKIRREMRNIMDEYVYGVVGPGTVWYVDSNNGSDTSGTGREQDKAYATLAKALTAASANESILVLPGHAETIAAATEFLMATAGVSVIGIGHGILCPTFTFSAAASTIGVTGANCRIRNINCIGAYAGGVTVGITVGAAADGLVLEDIRMEESAATEEFLIGVSIAAACHNVTIDGFVFQGFAAGTDSQCIIFVGASNNSIVRNFQIFGDFSGAAIDALTAKSLNMDIGPGRILNIDTGAGLTVSVKSDTTGLIHNVDTVNLKNDVGVVGAAMGFIENYSANAVNVQAIIQVPAVDA